jgi:hypothetical protein
LKTAVAVDDPFGYLARAMAAEAERDGAVARHLAAKAELAAVRDELERRTEALGREQRNHAEAVARTAELVATLTVVETERDQARRELEEWQAAGRMLDEIDRQGRERRLELERASGRERLADSTIRPTYWDPRTP